MNDLKRITIEELRECYVVVYTQEEVDLLRKNIRNFVQELTKHFMTDKTIQVGAKHDFNIRKVTRLQNHLT